MYIYFKIEPNYLYMYIDFKVELCVYSYRYACVINEFCLFIFNYNYLSSILLRFHKHLYHTSLSLFELYGQYFVSGQPIKKPKIFREFL